MGRQLWLADELRTAGLKVQEVRGWKTRGSADFQPIGVTWHATAGSRNATAQGEVNVILNGSRTAPPPIAQLMIFRDGTVFICAAGRCNHNKVGWNGPNEGLGNSRLFGIECANNNRGEKFPDVQLDALRRTTVVLFRKLGTDPRRRLAAHFEHQPRAGKPRGERSIKTDPLGIVMTEERPRIAAMLSGASARGMVQAQGEDDMEINDLNKALRDDDSPLAKISRAIPWQYTGGGIPKGMSTLGVLSAIHGYARSTHDLVQLLTKREDVDEHKLALALAPAVAALVAPQLAAVVEADGPALTQAQLTEAFEAAAKSLLEPVAAPPG
jgi:hypothetical protein